MRSIEEEMKGKIAIVTGGNTGIGYGCAKVFLEAGMNVVIAARRKERGRKPPNRSMSWAAENAHSSSAMSQTMSR